eukprot:COSAG02_NODE_4065_length_5840_cov_16.587180_3_plen_43_part_00
MFECMDEDDVEHSTNKYQISTCTTLGVRQLDAIALRTNARCE